MRPDISVIAVTYNSESVVEQFLQTLDRMVERLNLTVETLLTDNASQDGTREIIRQADRKFPQLNVTTLLNEKNVGLSKALNEMLTLCRGQRILICNPDIELNESIRDMLKISQQHPELVLVPELVEIDGTPQRATYGRFPTVMRIVSELTVIGDLPRLLDKIREDYRYAGRRFKRPIDQLEHVSAVCMLIDRTILTMLSPFYDPAFPVYWNDVDMSKRAQLLGIRRAIVPTTEIFHGQGASVKNASPEKVAMFLYSSYGMIGYARRWNMHPNILRFILFCDCCLRISREIASRTIGRRTRKLSRTTGLKPLKEVSRRYLLPFRCTLR